MTKYSLISLHHVRLVSTAFYVECIVMRCLTVCHASIVSE